MLPPRTRIILERFRLNPLDYISPYLVFIILLIIFYLILRLGNLIGNININTLITIIISFQAFFALIQLFIANQQKKYAKLAYLPKLIIYTGVSPDIIIENWNTLEFPLVIKNLGGIAYNLGYQIVIKEIHKKKDKNIFNVIKSKKVTENIINGKEFFLNKDDEKPLMQFKKEDKFIEREIVVDVIFEDIFYSPHRLRFIKLPQEAGFRMIATGIDVMK